MIVEKKGIVYEIDTTTKTGFAKYSDSRLIEAKIQEEINGCIIDTIESRCFFYCEKLKKVYIPNTIKKIKNDAFRGCKKLKKINDDNNIYVKHIGFNAFSDCISLSSIKLNNLISLGKGAFKNCESLVMVFFPETGFEVLEENVFCNCPKLMDITLTKDIRIVKDNFNGCVGLKKIVFKNEKLPVRPFIMNISKDVLLLGSNNSTIQEMSIYGYNFKLDK